MGDTNHDNTPKRHDNGEEDTRTHSLEQDVGEGFESGVGHEEDGQTGVVLAARHVQVGLKAVDLGIADVGAVEEGYEVEEAELLSPIISIAISW